MHFLQEKKRKNNVVQEEMFWRWFGSEICILPGEDNVYVLWGLVLVFSRGFIWVKPGVYNEYECKSLFPHILEVWFELDKNNQSILAVL